MRSASPQRTSESPSGKGRNEAKGKDKPEAKGKPKDEPKGGPVKEPKHDAKEGIRANSIHPGFVVTPMTASYQVEERIAQTPMGRLATPEDIAPGALFLACDDSRYMTGSELVIDGGLTVH